MRLIDVEHFCDCGNSFSECDVCMKAEACDFISTQPTFNLAEHDKEVRNKTIEEYKNKLFDRLFDDGLWKSVTENDIDEIAEQMKEGT